MPSKAQARRPADIFVESRGCKVPLALDFAVTSGLREIKPTSSEADVNNLFAEYEQHKNSYKNTEQQCCDQGFRFHPLVFEAQAGGVSPQARALFDALAREAAASTREQPEALSLRLAQRMSCALQRETARAVIRRQAEREAAPVSSGWSAASPADVLDEL